MVLSQLAKRGNQALSDVQLQRVGRIQVDNKCIHAGCGCEKSMVSEQRRLSLVVLTDEWWRADILPVFEADCAISWRE